MHSECLSSDQIIERPREAPKPEVQQPPRSPSAIRLRRTPASEPSRCVALSLRVALSFCGSRGRAIRALQHVVRRACGAPSVRWGGGRDRIERTLRRARGLRADPHVQTTRERAMRVRHERMRAAQLLRLALALSIYTYEYLPRKQSLSSFPLFDEGDWRARRMRRAQSAEESLSLIKDMRAVRY